MKDVLCLATGKSYNIVLETCVTAHPACPPYPRWTPIYVIPIKKGGYLEHLYRVVEIIECFPDDIYKCDHHLSAERFNNLCQYHEKRSKSFGYGKANTKYRFYILKHEEIIKQPCMKKGIQVSAKIKLSELRSSEP